MNLRALHRRLAVVMALASLLAFAGGAGFEPVSAVLAGTVLVAALFWRPSPELSARLERIWVPLAGLLVLRALFHVFVAGDDIVIPVVDLLLLLLSAEALRSLDAANDARLYALSFALLLASAAYRPGILFAVAFLIYVVVGTLALFVGHLRREAERNRVREVAVGRRLLLGVAGLSMVTLTIAVGVFLTFPRVSRGWTGRGETATRPVVGFSDQVSIGEFGATLVGNPQIVLRVEFPDGPPGDVESLYWRGRSYDRFDGERWSRTPRLPPALAPEAWYGERWGEERIRQRIYSTPLEARVLFGLHPVLELTAESRIQPLFDNTGDYTYWGSAPPVYEAVSMRGRPSPEALRAADGRFTPARGFYTQLPPELPDRVHALADSLAGGLEDRYARVVAIRDWLRTEFEYTLELPGSRREATLDHFLFQRRAGHCEYFSTALAVLLRSQGVPARNVNGFLGGDWSDFGGYLAVTQNQAHSWVEVWFPGLGWVPFDATPPGGGGSSSAGSDAWFWPGRFLLDAVQHRWGKWVLDYSVDDQWNLLDRASAAFSDDGDEGRPDPVSGFEIGRPLLWGGLGIVLLLGVTAAFRRRRSFSFATREFLRLRRHARKAGFSRAEELAPLAFLERLRTVSHPATDPVEEFLEVYLHVRFAGEPLTDERRSRLKDARRRARTRLKDARRGAGAVAMGNET